MADENKQGHNDLNLAIAEARDFASQIKVELERQIEGCLNCDEFSKTRLWRY